MNVFCCTENRARRCQQNQAAGEVLCVIIDKETHPELCPGLHCPSPCGYARCEDEGVRYDGCDECCVVPGALDKERGYGRYGDGKGREEPWPLEAE